MVFTWSMVDSAWVPHSARDWARQVVIWNVQAPEHSFSLCARLQGGQESAETQPSWHAQVHGARRPSLCSILPADPCFHVSLTRPLQDVRKFELGVSGVDYMLAFRQVRPGLTMMSVVGGLESVRRGIGGAFWSSARHRRARRRLQRYHVHKQGVTAL